MKRERKKVVEDILCEARFKAAVRRRRSAAAQSFKTSTFQSLGFIFSEKQKCFESTVFPLIVPITGRFPGIGSLRSQLSRIKHVSFHFQPVWWRTSDLFSLIFSHVLEQ